ncbi:MAG: ATP-dependent DNA helicase RecQ, partial [Jannaschia sp.]
GATKLERYGGTFLSVITGDTPDPQHPARRKLAGRTEGDIYDRLLSLQNDLSRGATGHDKPMTCSSSQLAKVARAPADADALRRILGDRHAERFGAAFLEILRDA